MTIAQMKSCICRLTQQVTELAEGGSGDSCFFAPYNFTITNDEVTAADGEANYDTESGIFSISGTSSDPANPSNAAFISSLVVGSLIYIKTSTGDTIALRLEEEITESSGIYSMLVEEVASYQPTDAFMGEAPFGPFESCIFFLPLISEAPATPSLADVIVVSGDADGGSITNLARLNLEVGFPTADPASAGDLWLDNGILVLSGSTAPIVPTFGVGVETWLTTPSFTNLNAALTGDDVPGIAADNTFTGRFTNSKNGAASAPQFSLVGTWFSGGTGTTTKPALLVEPTGTTSTTWSTSGTAIGVNAASGFVGDLVRLAVNNAEIFNFRADGRAYFKVAGVDSCVLNESGQWNGKNYVGISTAVIGFQSGTSISASTTPETYMTREGTGIIRFGANAAVAVPYTLKAHDARAGTDSNTAGANLTVASGRGTGTGAVTSLLLQSPIAVGSGTGAQTLTTGWTIKNGVALATGYTVAGLPTASGVPNGIAVVTDANEAAGTSIGVAPTGGGAVLRFVYSNGTNWLLL